MPSTPARSLHAEPRPDLGRLAVARRLAAGYAPAEAARAARVPAPDVDAMLADPGFAELVDAYREVEDLPEDAQVARLVRVAKCVLEDALNRGDARAALFVVREGEERGRSPARVLAERAVRALRRRAEAVVAPLAAVEPDPLRPAARRRPAAHPNDRAMWRVGARLRDALLAEHVALGGAVAAGRADSAPPSPRPSPILRTGEGEEPSPPPSPSREGEGARGEPPAPRVRPLARPEGMGEGRGEGGQATRKSQQAPAEPPRLNRHERRRAAALARCRPPPARSRGSP